MLSGTPQHSAAGPRLQPLRLAAFAVLLASGVLATTAGVFLGGAIQDRFAAQPTAGQTRALERIDAPAAVTTTKAQDMGRGPNRADLGGGAADLGAAR